MAEDHPAEAAPELAPEEMNAAPDQEQALDSTYEQVGVPYGAQSTLRKGNGFVGAPPSSLAALANGRKYLSDPLTPVTPRPNVSQSSPPPPRPLSPPPSSVLLFSAAPRGTLSLHL